MSIEPALVARSLVCGYFETAVLEQIEFELRSGEVVALLGPNGCGKSTLLKTFVGSIPPISGELSVAGASIRNLSPADLARTIAFVPQIEEPRFGFTVRQIVAMGRIPHGRGIFESREDETAIDSALDRADCMALQHRLFGELSGGERQRALIARALAQCAPIIAMDEPTAHLDPAHVLDLANLVRTLAGQGTAIVMAIHDLNLASLVADRAALISNRRIVLDDEMSAALTSKELDAAYGVEFEKATVGERIATVPLRKRN